MTLEQLNAHLALVSDLHIAEDVLRGYWNAAHPGGQTLTGMPHTSGIKDKVGDLAAEIADIETDIEDLKEAIAESEAQVMTFIRGVKDIQARSILRLRFCRGLTWKEVAQVLGGGNTEASVKMSAYRQLETRDDEC